MANNDFFTLLNEIETGNTTVLDICKQYNEKNPSPKITNKQFDQHPFFKKYFSSELYKILEDWLTDGMLNDDSKELFEIYSQFLLKLTKANSNSKRWLNQQTQIIDLTEKCLNEIALYGYYIAVVGHQDKSLESFDWLLQSLKNCRCQQILDELVKCVTCRFYMDAFYLLTDENPTSLTITQHFLLVTCPDYILRCDIEKTYYLEIVNKMLFYYNEIFSELLIHIDKWSIPVILTMIYPIRLILAVTSSLTFEQRKIIYEVILTIILNKSTVDQNIEEVRPVLIYFSLCLLIEIMRSDIDLANQLKNKTDKKSDLINILNNLSKNDKNDNVRLKALALVSLLIPEDEFLKENKTEDVTGLFIKNFNDALGNGVTKEIDEVLRGVKDLVQNDEFKQEVVKQNGLTPIMKYAKENKDDPLPLEITYAMTFNDDAKKVINQDKEFVDHIKTLRNSDKKKISKTAHGIVWKLEEEEKFKTKEENEDKLQEKSDEATEDKNDMMISYCWAQKELCHKINDRLEKDGYKVWLDRDEMHGSIIESMANAIEHSRFVLMCMSSNYKNSINCKAEAEYAFNRKSKIVPLIVEPKYRADGWLGFLAGSKIYVDFADKEDEEFEQAYQLLIAELERNGLKDTDDGKPKTPAPSTSTDTKSETTKESEKESEKEPKTPRIETTEYLNVGPAPMWTEVNVTEFLTDNQLEQLIPICQSMDGEALIEFHRTCETAPDKMYPLINNPKEHPVSFGTFFKFISKLKKYLPSKPPQKIYFQYNYVTPSPTKPTDKVKQ